MNAKQAKQIELSKILDHFGLNPIKRYPNYHIYKSPFRNEHTPSFTIFINTNLWMDYGSGEKGNVIDLVQKIKNCDFQEALDYMNSEFSNEIINKVAGPPIVNNVGTSQAQVEKKDYIIDEVKPLQNVSLLKYIKDRNINTSIAKEFCKEIYWTNKNGKKIFAVAFENESNGYSVRNSFYKGALSTQNITFIDNHQNNLKVFEGFMDFLSFLTENNDRNCDYVILNSVSMVNKIKQLLDVEKYISIESFLDNDKAGRECFEKLQDIFPNIVDRSNIYGNYNDYNEYLTQKTKINR